MKDKKGKPPPHVLNEQQMISALLNSGYLLEQRVEHYLQKQGFRIASENYFIDEESKKLREVDVIGENDDLLDSKVSSDVQGTFTFKLICECENNSNPVVFFPNRTKLLYGQHALIYSQIPYSFGVKNPEKPELVWGDTPFSHRKVIAEHHVSKMEIATQYCTFQPKEKHKLDGDWIAKHDDEQHQTLSNLLKASLYVQQRDSWAQEHHMGSFKNKYQITLYYPVIVLQNGLKVAFENRNGEIKLEDREHVVYMRFVRAYGYDQLLMIDVIQEKYLPTYVSLVKNEVRAMHNRILKNPHLKERIATWEKDYTILKTEQLINSRGWHEQDIL